MMLACRLRAVPVLAGLVGLVAFAAPAAASPVQALGSCPGQPAAVFAPWHDNSLYLLAPDGGLEAGGAGWSLTGGASVVPGGDPFALGGRLGARALSLPSGSSATSPAACISKGMPTFRLTARNAGAASSRLRVTVVYGPGAKKASKIAGDLTAGSAWAPVKQLSLSLGQVGDATSLSFRFTPLDSTGSWQVDSLYIDPRLSR
jgi:hypothetical protein